MQPDGSRRTGFFNRLLDTQRTVNGPSATEHTIQYPVPSTQYPVPSTQYSVLDIQYWVPSPACT